VPKWHDNNVGRVSFSAPAGSFVTDASLRDLDNRNRQLGVLRLTDATIAQSFSKN
jgi:hypothetical protein